MNSQIDSPERKKLAKNIPVNMSITGLLLTILFSAVSVFCSCSSSVKNKNWTEDYIISKKHEFFAEQADKYLTESNFCGSVLIGQGKHILFAKGYGVQDKNASIPECNTIHTTFEVGSVCKQMTATAIMQLVQKKKISVNEPISKYFPDFPHGNDITIKMLLTMHSGLTDHINCTDDFFPPQVAKEIKRAEIKNTPLKQNLVLESLNQAPLIAKPGKTYFYCNTDYYLLAKIIEKASGKDFYDYMNDNLFKKCGMNNTNQAFQQTEARGYDYKNRYYSIPSELAFGCGDVNSNVIDIFKWNTCFASGKLLRKKYIKEMTHSDSYGYGVYCDGSTILHGGTTHVFNAYNSYNFNNKMSFIVLTNKPINECNATTYAGKLMKIWENCRNN